MQVQLLRSACYVALIILVSACATPPPAKGIPKWDFEHDELNSSAIGALIGQVTGSGAALGAIAGAVAQDRIDLSPQELSSVIFSALSPVGAPPAKAGALSFAPGTSSSQTTTNLAENRIWTVAESNEGQLTTDWRRVIGRKAGVLWWMKEYQTEVRHTIRITRSMESARFTNFAIETEVRERPNDSYPWVRADPELGRASFEALKQFLVTSVRNELQRKRGRR